MRFNTGIAAMMEFVNGAYKWEHRPRAALEQFVLLLAPYAPHLAEEMWQVLQLVLHLHARLQVQLLQRHWSVAHKYVYMCICHCNCKHSIH